MNFSADRELKFQIWLYMTKMWPKMTKMTKNDQQWPNMTKKDKSAEIFQKSQKFMSKR